MLDRLRWYVEKAKVVLNSGEHPDKQFRRLYLLRKTFRHRSCQASNDELITQLIIGSKDPYRATYTKKLIKLFNEKYGCVVQEVVLEKLQELGSWRSCY